MRKALRRKGSWPEGKSASIMDSSAEGNIFPDRGKAGDCFIGGVILKDIHLL